MIIEGAMGIVMMIAVDITVDLTIEETEGIDMIEGMMIGVEDEIDMMTIGIANATTRQREDLELLSGMQKHDDNLTTRVSMTTIIL